IWYGKAFRASLLYTIWSLVNEPRVNQALVCAGPMPQPHGLWLLTVMSCTEARYILLSTCFCQLRLCCKNGIGGKLDSDLDVEEATWVTGVRALRNLIFKLMVWPKGGEKRFARAASCDMSFCGSPRLTVSFSLMQSGTQPSNQVFALIVNHMLGDKSS
ncbi:hypothetical protein CEXT_674091, partial [Caerostris extrusa]